MMTRREALKTTALATVAAAATPSVLAQTDSALAHPFELPPLPYALDALEPHLDARTMEIHHDRHHKAYVDNLNKAVAAQPRVLGGKTIEEILSELGAGGISIGVGMAEEMGKLPSDLRTAIRNNGGGHYNHSLFWQLMKKGGGGEPKSDLAKAIDTNFGSFSAFKDNFNKAALGQFGSGWAWLVLDRGKLKIESTPNQDTPLRSWHEPLLGVDVWEHAYYLKYQNRRADYLAAWWNVVNWDFVAERYAKLKG